MRHPRLLLVAALTCAALAACGGDDVNSVQTASNGAGDTPSTVPPTSEPSRPSQPDQPTTQATTQTTTQPAAEPELGNFQDASTLQNNADMRIVSAYDEPSPAQAPTGDTMMALTDDGRARVEAAIADLETRSSAELGLVVAGQAHDYGTYPFLWAAAGGLCAGGALAVAAPLARPTDVILVEGLVFAAAFLLLHFTRLGAALVPKRIKIHHARRLAAAEFANLVAQKTEHRTGLLLFVALTERHVEILVDCGIDTRVPRPQWQMAVERFRGQSRQNLADGLVAAIAACATILEKEFPANGQRRNAIPDRVTEI